MSCLFHSFSLGPVLIYWPCYILNRCEVPTNVGLSPVRCSFRLLTANCRNSLLLLGAKYMAYFHHLQCIVFTRNPRSPYCGRSFIFSLNFLAFCTQC